MPPVVSFGMLQGAFFVSIGNCWSFHWVVSVSPPATWSSTSVFIAGKPVLHGCWHQEQEVTMADSCHCSERSGKKKAPPKPWKIVTIILGAGRAIYSLFRFVEDLG